MSCSTGITIPTLENDICVGKTYNTKCVIKNEAIIFLDLDANSTLDEIIDSMVLSLSGLTERVGILEEAMENVRPYTSYSATIFQDSTNDPTVVILENTIGEIGWSRNSTGLYVGTLPNAFVAGKTFLMMPSSVGDGSSIVLNRVNVNTVNIRTTFEGNSADSLLLDGVTLEIRIYE